MKSKGRVERTVPGVRGHLLAGRHFTNVDLANERAVIWCTEEIGRQVHGTTKQCPLDVFESVEKGMLLPLPAERFEMARWQTAQVGSDQNPPTG